MSRSREEIARSPSPQEHLDAVRKLLARHRVVEGLAHRQAEHDARKPGLVENLTHKQNVAAVARRLEALHPADVAYILEGLPLEERLLVWELIPVEKNGEILLETSDAVRDTLLIQAVQAPLGTQTLEGYLFPDTYDFPGGTTARQAVQLMVNRFERMWKPDWNARLRELRLTRHQVVTLASIVEKEVRRGEERPLVAAVYSNRLRIRMPLQADPTVQYATAKGRQALTRADLAIEHPYNTYRRPGLPPGPIASPGLSAIEATLDPAPVKYLYFVALDDRRHHFSATIEEHNAAVARYREWRRSGGRAVSGRAS